MMIRYFVFSFFLLVTILVDAQSSKAIEQALFRKVNQYRVEMGLDTLVYSALVYEVSYEHALEMKENAERRASWTRVLAREDYEQYALNIVPRFLTHDGFVDRVEYINKKKTYKSAAENLAWGSDAQEIFNSWEESRIHRNNMLTPEFNASGIGVVKDAFDDFWCVQVFVEF